MIKDEGAKDLAAPLGMNRHIRQLYLNGAVAAAWALLGAAIIRTPGIYRALLSPLVRSLLMGGGVAEIPGNQISDEGSAAFAQGLEVNLTLELLDLSGAAHAVVTRV